MQQKMKNDTNNSSIKLRILLLYLDYIIFAFLITVYFCILVQEHLYSYNHLLLIVDLHQNQGVLSKDLLLQAIHVYTFSINMIWSFSIAVLFLTALFIYFLVSLKRKAKKGEIVPPLSRLSIIMLTITTTLFVVMTWLSWTFYWSMHNTRARILFENTAIIQPASLDTQEP